MLDDVEAHVAIALDEPRQVRGDELGELGRPEEGAGVEAVVGAEGKAVQPAVLPQPLGVPQRAVHHRGRVGLDLLGLIHQAVGEVLHVPAVRYAKRRVAMHREIVAVAGLLPHPIDQAADLGE